MINYFIFSLLCTGSMIPTMDCQDLAIGYELQSWQQPQIGSIYIYERTNSTNSYYVIHRLVNITNGEYIFQGDNNKNPDYPISRDKIKFKIISKQNETGGIEYV